MSGGRFANALSRETAPGRLLLREQLLDLAEAVRPTVAVKLTPRLGPEGTLPEEDLSRLAEISKRQLDQGFNIVGSWILPYERVREPRRRINFAELPSEVERIALGRLHLDSVAVSDPGVEFKTRDGEALRPPPLGQLFRIEESPNDDRTCSGNHPPDLEG